MNVQFNTDLPTTCALSNSALPPGCASNPHCFDVQIPDNYVYPNLFNVSVDLGPGINANGIYFWATTGNVGSTEVAGAFLDNIVMTCRNELIEGIISTPQLGLEKCSFGFRPDLSGLVSIDEIHWDFGDGNTSTANSPSHDYSNPGTYIVTLTIVDEAGCCTTVETVVMCDSKVCDYYVCWVGDDETMQIFEKLSGFSLIDQNGQEQYIELFNPPIDIEGNYDEIYAAFQNVLVNQYGLDPNQIKQSDPEVNCHKGTYAAPGFFVCQSEIPIISFDGWLDNGATASTSVDFYVKNCN